MIVDLSFYFYFLQKALPFYVPLLIWSFTTFMQTFDELILADSALPFCCSQKNPKNVYKKDTRFEPNVFVCSLYAIKCELMWSEGNK